YRGVTDCVHALRLFSARPREFDLIITDHTMPKMTGVELCREILRIRPEMPIILCTGYNEAFTKRCAVNPGIRFLIKPFDMRQISELVREVLDMERA
ncbi:MAG: response regulator, partial [Syntrophobacteraceae bacterium]